MVEEEIALGPSNVEKNEGGGEREGVKKPGWGEIRTLVRTYEGRGKTFPRTRTRELRSL